MENELKEYTIEDLHQLTGYDRTKALKIYHEHIKKCREQEKKEMKTLLSMIWAHKHLEYVRKWRKNNREKIKKWQKNNREKVKVIRARYYAKLKARRMENEQNTAID